MAKFNESKTIRTVNKSGHAAYSMADKAKLVTQVLTSFFNEAKFYGDNSAEMQETIKRVIEADPAFVSKLAVFARREFNMRSVSHVLTAYLAHEPNGKPYVRDTVRGVCLRGDDLTEILAFYLATFGKPIPNALKNGINDAFVQLDEYSLAKYKGTGKAVKMRDILCLCRPKPMNREQSALWKKVLENTLETPVTWETELSANGNTKESWEKLIDSGKVGYMALLRNLRNIIAANPSNIDKVFAQISNPEAVRKSRQLPFRFLSAYKEVSGTKALDALETAVDAACDNLPHLPGTTVIAVDVSGSMYSRVSANSQVRCCEIGMMLGLIANRICENAIFYEFDNHLTEVPISHKTGILYAAVNEARASGGTNMNLPFIHMVENNVRADRLIIISDNECNAGYNEPVSKKAAYYRSRTGNNDMWVHAIDLQGYGTQQFHGTFTNIIAGWSEKVFDFILLAEQGEGTLEKQISEYTW